MNSGVDGCITFGVIEDEDEMKGLADELEIERQDLGGIPVVGGFWLDMENAADVGIRQQVITKLDSRWKCETPDGMRTEESSLTGAMAA